MVVSNAEDQHLMRCRCGKHYRLMTLKGAQDNKHALRCKLCRQDLSSHALAASKVLDTLPWLYVWEAKVLRGTYGPLDFYMPHLNLAVEVDGEHHYQGKIYHESKALVQRRDFQKMREAWDKGVRMLRVPYFHTADLRLQLWEAVHECIAYPTARFVLWSTDTQRTCGVLERRGDTLYAWHVRWMGAPPPP